MQINYEEMFRYVKNILIKNEGIKSLKPQLGFRNRFEHTRRVFGWAKRILPGVENCNEAVVLSACIFHDCGYQKNQVEDHAILSERYFREYAIKNAFEKNFIEQVSSLILVHSDKKRMYLKESPIELVILLEADLLDEEGALGLVFDLLAEGFQCPDSYTTVFNEIMIHSAHILNQDYMVTPLAKRAWFEKKCLIEQFITQLKSDLFME